MILNSLPRFLRHRAAVAVDERNAALPRLAPTGLTDLVALVRSRNAELPPRRPSRDRSVSAPEPTTEPAAETTRLMPQDSPEAIARAIVESGRRRRAEVVPEFVSGPAQVEGHRATAAEVIRAAELARRGGHPLPEPTGLAAEVLRAGEKRRNLSR